MEPQHGEAEIGAHGAIDPAGAQDPGPTRAQGRQHGPLARCLAGAIDPQGLGGLVGAIGAALLAVEDKIGAQLQQPATGVGQGLGKGLGGASVHGHRQVRVALGPIHGGIGTGIEQPIGLVLPHQVLASGGVGQIEVAAAQGHQLHPLGPGGDQGLAQLARGAGEQHLHGSKIFMGAAPSWQPDRHGNSSLTASSSQRGASPSFSETWGLVPPRAARGQAIASSGSSQRIARSHSLLQ